MCFSVLLLSAEFQTKPLRQQMTIHIKYNALWELSFPPISARGVESRRGVLFEIPPKEAILETHPKTAVLAKF